MHTSGKEMNVFISFFHKKMEVAQLHADGMRVLTGHLTDPEPQISHLECSLDTATLTSCSAPMFSGYLFLVIITTKAPSVQTNVIERKVVQSNAETLSCLELVVHFVSEPAGSIRNVKYSSGPRGFSQHPEVSWHSLGTTDVSSREHGGHGLAMSPH